MDFAVSPNWLISDFSGNLEKRRFDMNRLLALIILMFLSLPVVAYYYSGSERWY